MSTEPSHLINTKLFSPSLYRANRTLGVSCRTYKVRQQVLRLRIGQGGGLPSRMAGAPTVRRWKSNIQTLGGSPDKGLQLRGVSYDLNATGRARDRRDRRGGGRAVVPEFARWEENGKDAHRVDYSRLTAL